MPQGLGGVCLWVVGGGGVISASGSVGVPLCRGVCISVQGVSASGLGVSDSGYAECLSLDQGVSASGLGESAAGFGRCTPPRQTLLGRHPLDIPRQTLHRWTTPQAGIYLPIHPCRHKPLDIPRKTPPGRHPQADTPLGRHPPRQTPPPLRQPLEQMVYIILECILV